MKLIICKRCVMDTTDSKIKFCLDGICDHCRNFETKIKPVWDKKLNSKVKFNQLIEKIKKAGKGKDFDCLLGVSGGVDSSYLTYITKKIGLNPLIFHVDAGWNSQIATNNIEKLVDKLNLNLVTEVIDWEEVKDLQLAFFKSGVSHVDTPQDHAFFATIYKFAKKYNIKYILTGANYSTECVRNPIEWMYYQSDATQLLDIHKKFGSKPLKKFPITSVLWNKLYLPYIKNIKTILLLNYIPYKKKEAMELLSKKFDWQSYHQKHFESRFTRFYESYWLPKRFGYDVRKVQFSSLILTGQMTREEALEKLSKPPYNLSKIEQDFEFIANKLDITVETLKLYMTLPKKTYKDYKSQQAIYNISEKVLKKMGVGRAGKR